MYGFLLLSYSNFVGKEIFDFKNDVTLKTGLRVSEGHWECYHSIEPITSYWRSIATMALSRVVSEIFNVERYRDREISVKGQSRSLKVVSFNRLSMVSY